MTRPSCESCLFFGVSHEHNRDRDEYAPCLRNPPTVTENSGAWWPFVHGYNWCGEHKPVSGKS